MIHTSKRRLAYTCKINHEHGKTWVVVKASSASWTDIGAWRSASIDDPFRNKMEGGNKSE